MTIRRKRYVVAAILGLAAFAVLVLFLNRSHDRAITVDEWLRAERGLSIGQVEALFGSPGKPAQFKDDHTMAGHVLVVLDSPSKNWVKAELAYDPAATWRVWPGIERDGNEEWWVVYFRNGVVVSKFGAGGPGPLKRLRYRLGL